MYGGKNSPTLACVCRSLLSNITSPLQFLSPRLPYHDGLQPGTGHKNKPFPPSGAFGQLLFSQQGEKEHWTDGAMFEQDGHGTHASLDESMPVTNAPLSLAGSCEPLAPPLLSYHFSSPLSTAKSALLPGVTWSSLGDSGNLERFI